MTMANKVLGLLGVGYIDFFVLLRDISRPGGLRGAIKSAVPEGASGVTE